MKNILKMRKFGAEIIRFIGKQICKIKGHYYFHPAGEYCSWRAYSCIRCGELDKPIESLPYRPDEDEDFYDQFETDEFEQYIEQQYEIERRWISFFRYPRWL